MKKKAHKKSKKQNIKSAKKVKQQNKQYTMPLTDLLYAVDEKHIVDLLINRINQRILNNEYLISTFNNLGQLNKNETDRKKKMSNNLDTLKDIKKLLENSRKLNNKTMQLWNVFGD